VCASKQLHTFVLLSTTKQREKKTAPKPIRIRKESHGNGCPRPDARRHRLECVRGETDKMMPIASGTWLKEKKVPLRKDMGRITKLMNTLMS